MSSPSDPDDARPSKRARLASDTSPTTTTATTAEEEAPQAPATAPIDNDLEKEIRAGIVEYVSPGNLGFTGVLKQRYTDFMVNEIGLDGRVVRLESVGLGKRDRGKGERKGEGEKGRKGEGEMDGAAIVGEQDIVKIDGEQAPAKQEQEGDGAIEGAAIVAEHDVKTEAAPQDGEATKETNGHEQPKVEVEESFEPSEEDLATLHSIFGESTTTQILSLVRSIRKHGNKKAREFKPVITPPIADKETRTQAHRSLRRIFPNMLESSMEANQSIRIKAVPPQERKGKKKGKGGNRQDRDQDPDRRRGQLPWDELGGEYLHFTLYKENKDTMEVVGFLGSKLGSGAKAFSFAGTKDRRACTIQRVCVKRQTAERMNGFNQVLFNAAIGDFSYHDHDLGLGDLKGNEFTITLRDCHFQGEEGLDLAHRVQLGNDIVAKAVKDFSERGYINYYGLQRFGTFSASTDTVGLKMLQGDLKGAVEDLLAYSDVTLAAANGTAEDSRVLVSQDDRNRAKALHIWKTTGKGSAALDILPRKFSAERNIIQHLSSRNSKTGMHDRRTDWRGALMSIPRNLRLMYVHAYQSLVWNVVAGKRWATNGDKVIEGDLVLVHEHKDKEESIQEVKKEDIDQDGEIVINPSGADSALAHEDAFERARPLTKDEAESGKYNVFDVVLPQPGFDVEYPKNSIGKFYEEFMASEKGGGLDPHKMRRPWKDISLSGGYRKFLAKPLKPLEFEVKEYMRDEEQFVETDLQRIRREKCSAHGEKEDQAGTGDVEMPDESEKKLAVVLKLELGSSQYATVALRELMKAGGVKPFKPEFMGGR